MATIPRTIMINDGIAMTKYGSNVNDQSLCFVYEKAKAIQKTTITVKKTAKPTSKVPVQKANPATHKIDRINAIIVFEFFIESSFKKFTTKK